MITAFYADEGDLEDVLSSTGVSLRLRDGPPSDVDTCLRDATILINTYAALLYPITQLAQSDWVNFAAKYIATFYLCARRGNPPPSIIIDQFEFFLEELKEIKKGHALIYDASPGRANVPVMSNHNMRTRPVMHSRVEAKRSTGRPRDYQQRRDRTDLAEWGALDWSI